jgi:hypothetical protein
MLRIGLVSFLLSVAGCATTHHPATSTAGALPPMYTVFMRVVGAGGLPPLAAPVTLRLCFDNDRQALVTVRALDGEPAADPSLTSALQQWSWRSVSSAGVPGGVSCWRERFVPDATGEPGAAEASVVEPVRMFELLADESERMREVAAAQRENESVIAALRIVETQESRFVVLAPALWVLTPKSAQARVPTNNPNPAITVHYQLEHMYTHALSAYRLCASPAGDVTVLPLVPILGIHHAAIAAYQTWRYPPGDATTCTMQLSSADVLMTRQPH